MKNRNTDSWGHALLLVHKARESKCVKSSSREWSMDSLTPTESKKTQTIKFSYTGMTIIHRNGKK